MDWQYIVVGILFVAAIAYVIRSLRGSAKGHENCGSADCKAHPKAMQKTADKGQGL